MSNESKQKVDAELSAALARVIPKSLDDIIRLQRDTSWLAMATEERMMELHATLNYRGTDRIMNDWRFIQLCALGHSETYLLALTEHSRLRLTSPVRQVDLDRGLAVTNSGTLYRLDIQGIGEPDRESLMGLCALLNTWPVGRVLGVPRWTFGNGFI